MRLYRDYSEDLLIFTYGRLGNHKAAINMVEEFFEDLWLTTKFAEIDPPIYKYLIGQIRNICDQRSAPPPPNYPL